MDLPRYRSKILDAAERRAGQGSFGDLGPGSLAIEEWRALGLELPEVSVMRAERLAWARAGGVRSERTRRRSSRLRNGGRRSSSRTTSPGCSGGRHLPGR